MTVEVGCLKKYLHLIPFKKEYELRDKMIFIAKHYLTKRNRRKDGRTERQSYWLDIIIRIHSQQRTYAALTRINASTHVAPARMRVLIFEV